MRIILSFCLLALFIYVATPKVNLNNISGSNNGISSPEIDNNSESKFKDSPDESQLDKFNNPVYYTLFKFILNVNPFKSPAKIS